MPEGKQNLRALGKYLDESRNSTYVAGVGESRTFDLDSELFSRKNPRCAKATLIFSLCIIE